MRTPMLGLLLLCASSAPAYTLNSVFGPWLQQQSASRGLLAAATATAGAVSAFDAGESARWDLAPLTLQAMGLPLSLPGGLAAGYQLRGGIAFPKGQAYLLHYQEGEPESDDHWFQLRRRRGDGSFETLLEFGTCIGEVRQLRLTTKGKGPEFLLLIESACGNGATFRLLHLDGEEPMGGALALASLQGDLALVDLDKDGRWELVHEALEQPPVALRLRAELASDYKEAGQALLRRSTAWRWDKGAWVQVGERWQRRGRKG